MILKFYLYSIFKNLRFADAFLFLYFLHLEFSFTTIGWLLGLQHLVAVILELPSGMLADRWGRCRVLSLSFLAYALSFLGYWWIDRTQHTQLTGYAVCLMLFAVGEAFRSGSHKAIMLSYLQAIGKKELATQVIGRTRSVSKFTSAVSAIVAGVIIYLSGNFRLLFLFSFLTSLLGYVLILSYPNYLERSEKPPKQTGEASWDFLSWHQQGSGSRFWALLFQSIVFESQCKMVLKYFLQPFVETGLRTFQIQLLASAKTTGMSGSGAVWIGVNEFLKDGVGGWGARTSKEFDDQWEDQFKELNVLYLVAFLITMGVALVSLSASWGFIPGILLLIGLAFLQNLRRPVFLAAFDTTIRNEHRATAMAAERVLRALLIAMLLPVYGVTADQTGLGGVWVLSAIVFGFGFATSFAIRRVGANAAEAGTMVHSTS